ncbi:MULTISPECIES: GlxA family transcriptional regulator [Mesorhizobium]|uniref:GlxA family transcriptional regulator n=1 Tax=Mesorhizobium TaxID=68287 RepID=UPI0003CE2ABB|nr:MULTISPECIES: GlxA family transcriptional regulator [Mesorhizobium]ESY64038.1 hypothetical protein X742_27000 [Mesorhizobium sp. LNHC232B00]WJI35750.1 GlxA family transcriptional regulator [Mesorhizobium opportunistum]
MNVAHDSPAPPDPDLRVGFMLLQEFTLLPFTCLVESLRHAADEGDRSHQIYCRWSLVAPDLRPIRSSCGLEMLPNEIFPACEGFDYIIVIGGRMPFALEADEASREYLRQAISADVPVVGVDNGAMLLAQMGMLDGRECAIHFFHRVQLQTDFPLVVPVTDRPFVDLGDIITCPGGAMALDLAVYLVSKHCGKARAQKGLRQMMMETSRLPTAASHMQTNILATCGDWRVERAIHLMEFEISSSLSVAEIARKVGTSSKDLNRAFQKHAQGSPSTVFRHLRLDHSRWLLLNTARTITQIAHECGFTDAAHFSRWFQRRFGAPPSRYRKSRQKITRDLGV